MITGGTGSFGQTVLKRFLDTEVKEIRIFSRDEKKQEDMRIALNHPKLRFYIGDVRDEANRCFDQRVPEELNRKVLDHLSDINLVLTEHARRYLIAEGIRPETIIKTGSHMREVLDHYMPKIQASDVLQRMQLQQGKYFIVSAHREENVDSEESIRDLLDSLNGLAETYDVSVIVSTHPRTRKRLDALSGIELDSRVQFMKPFGFCDYIRLQMDSLCVISDTAHQHHGRNQAPG